MKILGLEELTNNTKIWRMIVAEFVGTLLLVMIGCGSIMYSTTDNPGGVTHIAFSFGLTAAAVIQTIGHVSGGHINPAVTLSFLIIGKCYVLRAIFFVIIQCAGATAGFYLLKLMTPSNVALDGVGTTFLNSSVTVTQGVLIEAFATSLLCLVVHAVCDEGRSDVKGHAPLSIGLAITVCHMFAIKYTGSSINPARSLGPALIYGKWDDHWVYWVGPFIGAMLAGLVYKLVFKVKKGDDEANSYDF